MKEYAYGECGVYKVASKSNPNLFYIGSTTDLRKREGGMLRQLRVGISPYRRLQSHVNRFGITDLEFTVLKICDKDHLLSWEQYFISELNPTFNINRFASSTANSKSIEAMQNALTDMNCSLFWSERSLLSILNTEDNPERIIPIKL